MSKGKKWLIAFCLTAGIGMLGFGAITYIVDPFFQYHKPVSGFPYMVDDQLNMNPGLAKNMDYDSILLGSSMTVNFNTSWFKEKMGLQTQKLSYNGAFPKDQSNIMEIVFDAKKDGVKSVFLGIDEVNYSANPQETKFPIPKHLYDKNYLNDVQYLLNKDVMLNYIFRPALDPKDKSDWDMIYKPWWQDEHYQKVLVMMYYEQAEIKEEALPKDYFVDAVEENLSKNICPYIEAHPETTFYIFYPPYSILYWNDVVRRNELDAVIRKYEYMTERLIEYENVKIFMFQDNEEIICNLNNYADYTHYHGRICEYMVECFANGTNLVTKENYISRLAEFKSFAASYDYEEIFKDWYN